MSKSYETVCNERDQLQGLVTKARKLLLTKADLKNFETLAAERDSLRDLLKEAYLCPVVVLGQKFPLRGILNMANPGLSQRIFAVVSEPYYIETRKHDTPGY